MYIQYTMDQLFLPMDLEDDIPENHLVRIVNAAVNRISDNVFAAAYPGGGRDSYHPKMLTKVIIYAYTQRIYSSRQIAKAVRENVMFMWIAGRQRPDFRTINRFRSDRMKTVLESVFTAVVQFLAQENYVKLEHYFVDGTKIEALVKYNTYHKEKLKKWQKDISKIDNWQYDEAEDTWTCAAGQKLLFLRESKETTESGYEIRHRHYRSANCEGCPLKSACTKAEGNREIKISPSTCVINTKRVRSFGVRKGIRCRFVG